MTNKVRRTNKYDLMDAASYEALMDSRNIEPYIDGPKTEYKNQGLGMTASFDLYASDYAHNNYTTWK